MPNAKDATEDEVGKPKFLLVGSTGSGKTSQMLTLPGKTFVYLFDPSALSTLKGHDIDYEMFNPTRVNLGAVSLSRGKSDPKTESDAQDVYTQWADHADEMMKPKKEYGEKQVTYTLENGTTETKTEYLNKFETYDNICFESYTTFSDIVMDRIFKLNGSVGQFPQQDDWCGQMQTITNCVRTFVSMNKVLLFTAHDAFKQDDVTSRMQNIILLTGRLRVKLPLLFSEILHMDCASTSSEIKYQAQTRPDRMNPAIRCTFRDLEMYEDMTIKEWDNPKKYGLGRLLKGK